MLPGFLDDNRGRRFPFRTSSLADVTAVRRSSPTLLVGEDGSLIPFEAGTALAVLPDFAIVDFLSQVGPVAGFDVSVDRVYLHAVTRVSEVEFAFDVRSTAVGLEGLRLYFTRQVSDPRFTTSAVEATPLEGEPESEEACPPPFVWRGCLTTGDLDQLADLVALGEIWGADDAIAVVEPALVRDLSGWYVHSLNLANAPRTPATPDPDCQEPPDFPTDPQAIATCIIGKIRFDHGYNLVVRISGQEFSFDASVGEGKGEPCAIVPAYLGESNEFEIFCDEVLRTINGVPGPNLALLGETGFTVTPDPENNRVIIAADFRDTPACADVEEEPESLGA